MTAVEAYCNGLLFEKNSRQLQIAAEPAMGMHPPAVALSKLFTLVQYFLEHL